MPDAPTFRYIDAMVVHEYDFGRRSLTELHSCDIRLQQVAQTALALSPIDFAIICGHRGEADQNKAYREGKSKLIWPHSKHNAFPSRAFDFAPWIDGTIPWHDTTAFSVVAGVIFAAAKIEGVEIEWGGHWRTFKDYPHFELAASEPDFTGGDTA